VRSGQFYSSSRTVPFGHSCWRAEWTDEGGGFDPPRLITPLHLHREDYEVWYVLEGALCVQRGD
jgi:mannose-6-phosphate isomerase-like protein (cupin superfamily)